MVYTNTYQSIHEGLGMGIHTLRVLVPRTNYDELIKVYTLKA